jgi:hypothetical protein
MNQAKPISTSKTTQAMDAPCSFWRVEFKSWVVRAMWSAPQQYDRSIVRNRYSTPLEKKNIRSYGYMNIPGICIRGWPRRAPQRGVDCLDNSSARSPRQLFHDPGSSNRSQKNQTNRYNRQIQFDPFHSFVVLDWCAMKDYLLMTMMTVVNCCLKNIIINPPVKCSHAAIKMHRRALTPLERPRCIRAAIALSGRVVSCRSRAG